MDYVIYGAGAIGSMLGATLVQAGRSVTLVARPAHVAAIRERGLAVTGVTAWPSVEIGAVEHFGDAPLADDTIVCLTMKTNDTAAALEVAGDALADRPVVAFQNGVHNERLLTEAGLRGYGGIVFCGAKFLEPGQVIHTAAGHFGIGRLPDGVDDVCERVAADVTAGGLEGEAYEDIMASKWTKLVRNLNNAYMAVTDLSVLRAAKYEDSRFFMADVMGEAIRVLDAAGIRTAPLGEQRPIAQQVEAMRRPGERPFDLPDNEADEIRSSTWQDLKLQRGRVEVEYFNGEIVRLGEQVGVPAPLNALIMERCMDAARHRQLPGTETTDSLRAALAAPA